MSPFLFSADHSASELGQARRAKLTVADAMDEFAADLIADFLTARREGRLEDMALIRDHAGAVDPQLVDEIDALDYPAAA